MHLGRADAARRLGRRRCPPAASALAAACWPGPLTLLLERRPDVPDVVTGGRATVGLRVPAHPLALELLRSVRRRRRGAVGEPLRPGEPDDRRATCGPISAPTSTSCSTAARAASASSRPSSTARPTRRRCCAPVASPSRRLAAIIGGEVRPVRAARAGRRACWRRTTRPRPPSRWSTTRAAAAARVERAASAGSGAPTCSTRDRTPTGYARQPLRAGCARPTTAGSTCSWSCRLPPTGSGCGGQRSPAQGGRARARPPDDARPVSDGQGSSSPSRFRASIQRSRTSSTGGRRALDAGHRQHHRRGPRLGQQLEAAPALAGLGAGGASSR